MEINRVWQMPNKNTFDINPIKSLIEKYKSTLPQNAVVVDPFANKNKIASVTNDLDEQYDTTYHMDATDFLKMLESNSVDMLLYDPPYCYDDKTEVFTMYGWKNIADITESDFVATLNPEEFTLEYHPPLEFIKKQYNGNMVKIDNQYVNLLITDAHRCYVRKHNKRNYDFVNASNLFDEQPQCYFLKSCYYDCKDTRDTFELPAIQNDNKYLSINMSEWMKFFGMYMAYGSCEPYSSDSYPIKFTLNMKESHNEFVNVIKKLGFEIKLDKCDNGFVIYSERLWTYLSKFKTLKERFIPEDYVMLNSDYLYEFILHMAYDSPDGKTITVYTREMMDTVSEFILKSNVGFNVDENISKDVSEYVFHLFYKTDYAVNKNSVTTERYDGYIYCLTVPNSILLVKRCGKVCWCGNSPRQVSECYKNLGKTVNMQTTQSSYWSLQKEEIGRIVKTGGYVITCSWNSGGIGKKYGFEIQEILLVPHGGWHNDTIVVVEKKI